MVNRALAAVPFLDIDFANLPETMVPLSNRLHVFTSCFFNNPCILVTCGTTGLHKLELHS